MALVETQLIGRILDPTEIRMAYQPIVDLANGDVVGVESLARWPGLLVSPGVAFGHAARVGRVEQLDSLCQEAAIEGTDGAGLPTGFKVFVNVAPGRSVATLAGRTSGPKIFAEISESSLLAHPAELLRSVRQLRDLGCGIALDNVGAVPASLGLLQFVAPDVIKLDMTVVQAWPEADQARILWAVDSYVARSGATILAEGVETDDHLKQAVALGATLGQGWYFSRPGPLARYPQPRRPVQIIPVREQIARTPFELIDPRRVRLGPKSLLVQLSRHLEKKALGLSTSPVVLSAFQAAEHFTQKTAWRYLELAARCPFVIALGAGMESVPMPGVLGVGLAPDDPIRGEWVVVVAGPRYASALIARDLGDDGPDLDRRYEFTVTHNHYTVLDTARILLGRIDELSPTPKGQTAAAFLN